jgi:hypothetical protein
MLVMFKFVAPPGFSGGDLFGIGLGDVTARSYEEQFEAVQGTLSISKTGEPLWLYCMSASGNPRPITVFNNGGKLAEPFLESYAEGESALPDGFPEEGIINLQHYDNLLYNGPQDDSLTDVDDLKAAIRDPKNWKGSNDERFQLRSSGSSPRVSVFEMTSTAATIVTAMVSVVLLAVPIL